MESGHAVAPRGRREWLPPAIGFWAAGRSWRWQAANCSGRDLLQLRLDGAAAVEHVGAAGVEAAAAGRIARARHVAFEDDAVAGRARHRHRHGGEQRAGVGVLGRREDLALVRRLDDLAEIHHRDAVGHVLDDREIVADEQQREAEPALQVLEQVDDLRLDRHVERRHRLVADDEVGLGGERAGDADALALAAGELVGPAVRGVARQAYGVEQHVDAPVEVGLRGREAEIADRLGEDVAHSQARIEARERVLEHHLHAPAQRPQASRPRDRRCGGRRARPVLR